MVSKLEFFFAHAQDMDYSVLEEILLCISPESRMRQQIGSHLPQIRNHVITF